MTIKDVAAKYGVPKNTLFVWVKNKYKLTTSLEKKGTSSSRKSTLCRSCDQTDKAIFQWFVGKRIQKVPTDGIILKGKALEFEKTLGIKEFKRLDCWFNKLKKRYKYNNCILFVLFCTTLNIFTKISAIFFGTVIFNLQGSCIPFPWPRLTSLPVMET